MGGSGDSPNGKNGSPMGGSDTKVESVQQTSQPTNPAVTSTLNSLLGGVQANYAAKPAGAVFGKSLYNPVGATTQQGWNSALGAANNNDYSNGVDGALGQVSKTASGAYLDNVDPNYQKMIDTAANGTAADINASMGADGAYGSNVHVNALGDAIGQLRLGAGVQNRQYEQGRMDNAISQLPGLFSARMAPSAAIGAVGAAQDANQGGILQGENDLFRRQNDASTNELAKYFSMLGSGAQIGGTTTTGTTTSPQTPWWQSLLGTAVALA